MFGQTEPNGFLPPILPDEIINDKSNDYYSGIKLLRHVIYVRNKKSTHRNLVKPLVAQVVRTAQFLFQVRSNNVISPLMKSFFFSEQQ